MNVELILQNSRTDNNCGWKIIYVISGYITATLNSSVYKLSGESMMLVSPEDFYYVKSNKHSDYKIIEFKLKEAEDFNLKCKVLNLGYDENQLVHTIISTENVSQNQILLQLLLNICEKSEDNIEPLKTEKTRLFKEVTVMMNRYIASSVSAPEFADMVGISLSTLKRVFAKYTGIGIHDYFLMLKINKAKELLAGGYSVTQTARVLQFSSQAYFSTAFKRVTGVSAKSYSMSKGMSVTSKRNVSQKRIKTNIKPSSNLPDYLL